jgi:ribosome-associated protein
MDILRLRQEIHFDNVRSRGPGGQNVNKVSSAAILTWDFRSSKLLRDDEKWRISDKLANRLNRDGFLQIRSDESRDLQRNKERCLEKLIVFVKQALHVPKARKKTKPTRASKIKRRQEKERRSETKKGRSYRESD